MAQYELGACLLKIAGASASETALFREEAVFWLRRSAWAGNARAQWKLATLLGAHPNAASTNATQAEPPAAPVATTQEALGWALIYTDNSDRELYALAPIHPEWLAHLEAALSPVELIEAQTFAQNFTPIKLASFEPPTFARGKASRDQRTSGKGGPQGGGRERRR